MIEGFLIALEEIRFMQNVIMDYGGSSTYVESLYMLNACEDPKTILMKVKLLIFRESTYNYPRSNELYAENT